MSDSESKDSDEGIRYKTDSVRNKRKTSEFPRKRSRDSHHKDDRSRHRKRYSRSPSPKKYSDKKCKKRRKSKDRKRNSSEDGSTSSSYDKSKNKFAKKEFKQKDETVSKTIGLHSQHDIKSSSVTNQIQVNQNEIIGPALPPHLQVKIHENPGSGIPSLNSTVEQVNKIAGDSTEYPSQSPVGPKLPPNLIINSTKKESCIGPSLPTIITTSDLIVEQSPHTFKDVNHPQLLPSYIGPQLSHLLNGEKYTELKQPEIPSLGRSEDKNADKVIGPSLPPHLRKTAQEVIEPYCIESKLSVEKDSPSLSILTTLVQSQTNDADKVIGPSLPPHLRKIAPEVIEPYCLHSKLQVEKDSPSLSILTTSVQSQTNYADKVIGPSLPPHLRKTAQEVIDPYCVESKLPVEQDSPSLSILTTLVQSQTNDADKVIGPSLPPHLRKIAPEVIEPYGLDSKLQVEKDFSSLPILTTLVQSQTNYADKVIGPSLPPHLRKIAPEVIEPYGLDSKLEVEQDFSSLPILSTLVQSQTNDADKVIGPSLPPHLRKKIEGESSSQINMQVEEEDVYGPLPAGMSEYSLSHQALEERALQLKIDQLAPQGNDEPVRESWMIELPSKVANFGLGPRQFRNRPAPDLSDRSSWTDLPGDKKKKKSGDLPVDVKAEAELRELRKRDEEQEVLTKKHKRKEKSLLKIHKEKLEKEKKNEKPNERRPFSRDIDLQANRFDDAQKQAIMKKAQLLDTRFSSGKSKFL